MKREKFNDKVTPNYNKNTTVHYIYQYTSWPVNTVHETDCNEYSRAIGKLRD